MVATLLILRRNASTRSLRASVAKEWHMQCANGVFDMVFEWLICHVNMEFSYVQKRNINNSLQLPSTGGKIFSIVGNHVHTLHQCFG